MLGVLAVYVCQGLFHELTYLPVCNALVFFLAGLTMGLQPLLAQKCVPAAEQPVSWLSPMRTGLSS